MLSILNNLFDTIKIQILRGNQGIPDNDHPLIDTGWMRFADLHDRRLLLYHLITEETTPATYKLNLSLEAYDSSEGSSDIANSYHFSDDPGS